MAITDPARARRLLENALAGKPALSTEQFDDLMTAAEDTVFEGDVPVAIYTGESLNRAAALGWSWKSALTADKYEIAGGEGRKLSRQVWWDYCQKMHLKYATGVMTVTGEGSTAGRVRGIRSVGMVSSAAVEATPDVPSYVINGPKAD